MAVIGEGRQAASVHADVVRCASQMGEMVMRNQVDVLGTHEVGATSKPIDWRVREVVRSPTPAIGIPAINVEIPATRRPWAAWILGASDIGLLLVCYWVAFTIRRVATGTYPAQDFGILGAGLGWLLIRWYFQLYPGEGLPVPEDFRRQVMSTLLAGCVHISILFGLHQTQVSRLQAFGVWVAILPASLVLRNTIKAWLLRRRLFGSPAVVLGAGRTGTLVIRELLAHPMMGLTPVAVYDDDPTRLGDAVLGIPVCGPLSAAIEDARKTPGVRHAIVALPRLSGTRLVSLVRQMGRKFKTLRVIPDLFGIGHLWVEPASIGACLALELRQERFDRNSRRIKRALDLVLTIPLAMVAIPIIGLAAIAVMVTDGKSPFYAQHREGLSGKRIRVWKIRTMVADAEAKLAALLASDPDAHAEWASSMKLQDDPRIIPVIGKFLRKFSIDELPQLLSVFSGELSLVGPRPFPDYHLKAFAPEFRALRSLVPPGVTGYWQVMNRSNSDLAMQEAADTYYIENWTIWLDLWVLFRTVGVVLAGRGAC